MAVRIDHDGLAANLKILRRRVAEAEDEVILALLRDVEMDEDVGVRVTRGKRGRATYLNFASTLGNANCSVSGMMSFPSMVHFCAYEVMNGMEGNVNGSRVAAHHSLPVLFVSDGLEILF